MANTEVVPAGRRIIEGRAIVVANPTAAGVTSAMVDQIAARLGRNAAQLTVACTDRAGDAVGLAKAAAADEGTDLIVAVGGDGTVREVSQGVVAGQGSHRPVVLALPAGSGNSTARNFWGEMNWTEVLDAALDRRRSAIRTIDLLHVAEAGVVAALGASSGFLAAVLVGARDVVGVRGIDRYHAAVGDVLAAMPADPTVVRVDGVTLYNGSTSLAAVGGGRYRAHAYQFLPHSVLDDGLLDVCVIAELSPQALAEVALLVLTGDHVSHPGVRYARGRTVTIERTDGRSLLAEYDGDVWVDGGATMTLHALPGALRVLASPRAEAIAAVSMPEPARSSVS